MIFLLCAHLWSPKKKRWDRWKMTRTYNFVYICAKFLSCANWMYGNTDILYVCVWASGLKIRMRKHTYYKNLTYLQLCSFVLLLLLVHSASWVFFPRIVLYVFVLLVIQVFLALTSLCSQRFFLNTNIFISSISLFMMIIFFLFSLFPLIRQKRAALDRWLYGLCEYACMVTFRISLHQIHWWWKFSSKATESQWERKREREMKRWFWFNISCHDASVSECIESRMMYYASPSLLGRYIVQWTVYCSHHTSMHWPWRFSTVLSIYLCLCLSLTRSVCFIFGWIKLMNEKKNRRIINHQFYGLCSRYFVVR